MHADALRSIADLVAAQGYAGTTLDQIARAAGVAKTTLYRRWASKSELALDALAQMLGTLPDVGADTESGLRAAIAWLAERIGDPRVHQLLTGLVAEATREPAVRAALRARIRAPFEAQVVAAWQIAPDRADLAFDVVVGSLLHHAALAGEVDRGVVDAVTSAAMTLVGGSSGAH